MGDRLSQSIGGLELHKATNSSNKIGTLEYFSKISYNVA